MASPDFGPYDEPTFAGRLRELFGDDASIRSISRQTGIPYSTLQAYFADANVSPSSRTVGRLLRAVEQMPVVRTPRLKTVVDDSMGWTANKLANLQPPRSANAFQVIGRTGVSREDTPRSGYIDLDSMSPWEYMQERGIDPRSVSRIVWARRGGFVRGF